jgi:hypothetical protein
LVFDWYVAAHPPKKEQKVPLSHHDITVCSLICGPLATGGALPDTGHEQKWLYIDHSDDTHKNKRLEKRTKTHF